MSHLDSKRGPRLLLPALVLCLVAFATFARAQQQTQPPKTPATQQQDDVVRVESDLVNTDVMVFDKSGKFVGGLGREQFQVTVDGRVVPVAFFEQVQGGAAPVPPARAGVAPANAAAPASTAAPPPSRGRYVAFFLDDVHLSP